MIRILACFLLLAPFLFVPVLPVFTDAGPNTASTGSSIIAGCGEADWNTQSAVSSCDGLTVGTEGISSGTNGCRFLGTNYSFSLPAGAIIKGVVYSLSRKSSATNSLTDLSIQLVVGGTPTGTDKADTVTLYGTSLATASYGSSSDVWGLTLSSTDVNASNFGGSIRVHNGGPSTRTASVQCMKITVTYTLGHQGDGFFACCDLTELVPRIYSQTRSPQSLSY